MNNGDGPSASAGDPSAAGRFDMYRWTTAALVGPWRPTREEALRDALVAGQADMVGEKVVPCGFVRIEEEKTAEEPPHPLS
jgi:hypothetical protein